MESVQNFYQLVQNYVMHRIHLFAHNKENQIILINKPKFTIVVNNFIQEAMRKIITDLYQTNNTKVNFIAKYKTRDYIREVLVLQTVNETKVASLVEKLPTCSFEYQLAVYEDGVGFGKILPGKIRKIPEENLYQELNVFLAHHLEKKANISNNKFQGMLLINNKDNNNQTIIPAERIISFINIAQEVYLIENNNQKRKIKPQNLFDIYEDMLLEKKNVEDVLSDSIFNSFV